MRYLTVALAKGRLAELAMDIFSEIGMDCSEMKEKTRKVDTDTINTNSIMAPEKNYSKVILRFLTIVSVAPYL